jgi:IS5 family transposase
MTVTLGAVITETHDLTGVEIKRAHVGHNAPNPPRVYRSGQKRGVHGQIKKEPRQRAAIEPMIGHLNSEGHLKRNYLKGSAARAEGRMATKPMPSSPPPAIISASPSDG